MPRSLAHPSRRRLLGFVAAAPAIAFAAIAKAQGVGGGAQTCPASFEDEASRASANYVAVSPHGAEKDCRNCEFWIPNTGDSACGGCTLIAGEIDPPGYCDSWALAESAQPSAANPAVKP